MPGFQKIRLFIQKYWEKWVLVPKRLIDTVFSKDAPNKYFDFELTEAQKNCFDSLKVFSSDTGSKIYILKGYAGTGKTSLMGGYIKWLQDKGLSFSLLASTGRAAKVLSEKTQVGVVTVHSHIYGYSGLDQDLEKLSHMVSGKDKPILLNYNLKTKDPDLERGHLYLVDESSMISDVVVENDSFARFGSGRLLKDLFSFDPSGKFVFVGDPRQLPPVGQAFSPALSKEYIKETYRFSVEEIELTTIKRQAGTNDIIKASMDIRGLHETNPQVKFASFPLKGYRDIRLYDHVKQFTDRYIETIEQNDFKYATMICQTNFQCSQFNNTIRDSLAKPPDKPVVGDILMITQNNMLSGLVNGDFVQIKEIREKKYYCGLDFISMVVEELNFKKKYEILLVENLLFSNQVNIAQQEHRSLLIDFVYRMKEISVNPKDLLFSQYMRIDPYLNAHKAKFGYAVTCHKSQGGEWPEVFLFMNNKIHGLPKPGIYQWLYTAVTRAKNTLHLIDDWYIKKPEEVF